MEFKHCCYNYLSPIRMAGKVKQSASKKLEALRRMQRLREMLKLGGMQSQAILDSAGESRPTDESHVAELLDEGGRSERMQQGSVPGPRAQKRKMQRKKRSRK